MKMKNLFAKIRSHAVIIGMLSVSTFVIGSIAYDLLVTRPNMTETLDRLEVKIDNISSEIELITPKAIVEPAILVGDTLKADIASIEK